MSEVLLRVKCSDAVSDQIERVLSDAGDTVRKALTDLLDTDASVTLEADYGLLEHI